MITIPYTIGFFDEDAQAFHVVATVRVPERQVMHVIPEIIKMLQPCYKGYLTALIREDVDQYIDIEE